MCVCGCCFGVLACLLVCVGVSAGRVVVLFCMLCVVWFVCTMALDEDRDRPFFDIGFRYCKSTTQRYSAELSFFFVK